MTAEQRPDSTIPPWRRTPDAAEPQPNVVDPNVGEGDQPLSKLEQILTTPGIAWAVVIGFAGGFGLAALLFVASGSLVLKGQMANPNMWYVYAGICVVALVLWSWFLSRIRIFRSQAQDPDFGSRKDRKRRRRKSEVDDDIDEDEEEEDEDDEPWL
jgi:hypothetical protein